MHEDYDDSRATSEAQTTKASPARGCISRGASQDFVETMPENPAERLNNYGILCIIFDNEKGPVIKASDPPECLAKSFHPLGQYFCPDQALAGRCVSLTLEPYDLHGLPIYIPSETYDRSCFRFCIAVLVECKRPARMLALQLAQTFYSLEMDRRYNEQKRHNLMLFVLFF
eukprot:GEMP01104989.1.p1 GENE.GEMP01104989.1~~GEMP01104989.1.p1  ORF type:complete len:198 (+),score=17.42 GEMP01104989.1:83-595(+)